MKKTSKKISYQDIPLNLISPDPEQPRQEFENESMIRLRNSIKQNGIKRPLALEKKNGKYLIIDGERRYKCAKELKLKTVPATIEEPMSSLERMVYRFNIQETTQSWSHFDKAKAIWIIKCGEGLSAPVIAKMLGLSLSTVSNTLAIMTLSKRVLDKAIQTKIPFSFSLELTRFQKLFSDIEIRQLIMENLIERYDKKEFLNYKDLRSIRKAFEGMDEDDREDEAKRIIQTAGATILEEVKKSTEVEISNAVESMMIPVRKLNRLLKTLKAARIKEYLSPEEEGSLKNLLEQLSFFLK